jgi:hypothetical protein
MQSPDDVTDFRRHFEAANRHPESSVGEELIEGTAPLDRAIYTIFHRLINGLRWSDPPAGVLSHTKGRGRAIINDAIQLDNITLYRSCDSVTSVVIIAGDVSQDL